MNTHTLVTGNGTVISVELKSRDDMKSTEYQAEHGNRTLIGLTGFEDKDKEDMMWELADEKLNMGEIMGFIDHFDHSAIYWLTQP